MRTLSDYLVEIKPDPVFAAVHPAGAPGTGAGRPSAGADAQESKQAPQPSPEEELAARLEAAYEQGLADERARAAAALEEAKADARAEKEAALEQARAAWASQEGERLGGLVVEGLAALERRIADEVARVLAPLVAAAARERALSDLARAIRTLLRAEPGAVLAVTGPADLGEAVLERVAEAAAAIRFTPGEGIDLVVEGETTSIETQIAAWAQGLAIAAATAEAAGADPARARNGADPARA